jgi:uncharacterized HAD superfamily protein
MAAECKTIYVDLDDVLCQAARRFLIIVERDFGKRIGFEELTDFDVGDACGLSPSERDELYRIVHRADELMSMEPIGDAVEVLTDWAERGYEIAIVTGRPPWCGEVSLAWLANHRIPHHSFTVVDKYSRFPPESTGAISLRDLARRRFCWAVEDSLPMAHYLAGHMRIPVVLLDRPWNQSVEIAGVLRHPDWQAIKRAKIPYGLSGASDLKIFNPGGK